MPRWPGGLHAASGSGTAYGYRPVRPPATPQEQYWRRTATELHAAATATQAAGAAAFVPPGPLLPLVAATGPQAAGEQWAVDLILVQLQTTQAGGIGVSSAPLVVQQIFAQQSGGSTFTPPPVVAQAWRCHASMAKPYLGWQTGKLLAQTTQGANDTLSVSGPVLTAGEVIAVVWYNWFPQTGSGTGFPWAVYQGTRYALSVT